MLKYCAHCGLAFETSSSVKKYCDRPHVSTCEHCGNEFPISNTYDGFHRRFCSKRCASLHRVAVQNRICSVCGGINDDDSESICENCRTAVCPICGKQFKLTSAEYIRGKQTCSTECRYILSKQTYQNNYSADTNPENYNKMIAKYKQTCMSRFGVDNPMKDSRIVNKGMASKRNKYGDNLEEITEKIQATLEDRYGSRNLMDVQKFREKSKQTCLSKYGVDNYAKSIQFLEGAIIDPAKAKECKKFRDDPKKFILDNFDTAPSLGELSELVGIRESSVGWIIDKANCQDNIRWVYSRMEDEVCRYIREIVPDINMITNTRKVITPYELDIYLPDYQLAIECNPTSTHNSSFDSGFGDSDVKSTSYHKMKTDMCEQQGIFLFHIFGYEWSHKSDIIKSMLSNLLERNSRRLGARSCDVREVSHIESSAFLEDNHRQGMCNSSIRLGLYYKNELVSLMTFGKMRNTIGASNRPDMRNVVELSRFCNKKYMTVSGGASKLFKYFCSHYQWSEIRSFSDRAHTKGNLYQKLGFEYVRQSGPGYMWVNTKSDVGYSRLNTQKQNIIKFLRDECIDLSLSETQIMEAHGYAKVCDSGTILWRIVNDFTERL